MRLFLFQRNRYVENETSWDDWPLKRNSIDKKEIRKKLPNACYTEEIKQESILVGEKQTKSVVKNIRTEDK